MDGKLKRVKSLEEPLLATIMHLKIELAWTFYKDIDTLYMWKNTQNNKRRAIIILCWSCHVNTLIKKIVHLLMQTTIFLLQGGKTHMSSVNHRTIFPLPPSQPPYCEMRQSTKWNHSSGIKITSTNVQMPLSYENRITHNANILNFHEKVDDCIYVKNIFVTILFVTIASSCHIIKREDSEEL